MEFTLQPVGQNYYSHSGLLIERGQARVDSVLCFENEQKELIFLRIENIFSVKARHIRPNRPRPAAVLEVFVKLVSLECSDAEDKVTGKKHLTFSEGVYFAFSDEIIHDARIVHTRKHPSEDSTFLIMDIQDNGE